MGDHILQRLGEEGVGENLAADCGVELCRLDEAPVIERLDHIAIDHDGGVDDLARAGIVPGGTHGILDADRDVADAGVLQVVGVKFRVVLGEVPHLHDVLQPDALKGLIPPQHTGLDPGSPALGEVVIDVVDDGLLDLGQFAPLESLHIDRLESPAADEIDRLDLVIVTPEDVLLREEEIDPRVAQSRRHRHSGQAEEGVGDAVGGRVVLQSLAPAIGERHVGGSLDAYGGIGLKGLHGGEAREVRSRAAGESVGPYLGDQCIEEALLIEEEVSDIKED